MTTTNGWQISYLSNGTRKVSRKLYTYRMARRLVARLYARGNDAYCAKISVTLRKNEKLAGSAA